MNSYTDDQLAETVCRLMATHGIEPTDDYTAVAGADYGYVAAWELPRLFSERCSRYALKYGNNGQTYYAVSDDIGDLAEWLIPDDNDLDVRLVEIANVRGIEAAGIEVHSLGREAPDDYPEPCRILVARDYYGPRTETRWVRNDDGKDHIREFPNAAAAQEYIDEAEDGVYQLSHNESGRPTYLIVIA